MAWLRGLRERGSFSLSRRKVKFKAGVAYLSLSLSLSHSLSLTHTQSLLSFSCPPFELSIERGSNEEGGETLTQPFPPYMQPVPLEYIGTNVGPVALMFRTK